MSTTIKFNKKELNPVMQNSTLSRGKLKAVLDALIKANDTSIFRLSKRAKKASTTHC